MIQVVVMLSFLVTHLAILAVQYRVRAKALEKQNQLLRKKLRLHEQLDAQRQLLHPQRSVHYPEIFWN